MFYFRSTRPLAVALAIGCSTTVFAETGIEEVLVSANFYDDQLMKSAGSISVMDAQSIQERAADHLESLLNAAANVNYSSGASRSRFLQLRGIGDLEQFSDPKHYPSVGIRVDELELGDNASAGMLFDVEQVEILRGPQGTRFGANALAGMVNIKTRAASETFEGSLHSGIGNHRSWHLGAIISGPLSDNAQGRLSVQKNRSDGYIDNIYLNREDSNGLDETAVRGKLHWDSGQRAQYDLNALYFNSDNGYDTWSLDNARETLSDQPGFDNQQQRALAAKGQWQWGKGHIEAIASWNNADLDYGYDADWVYTDFCVDEPGCSPGDTEPMTEAFLRERENYSLDIRLLSNDNSLARGESRYVLGLYSRQSEESLQYRFVSQSGGEYRVDSRYDNERYALYGQIESAVSQRLQITAGLRLERFSDDFDNSNAFRSNESENLWNGELSAEFQYNDNTLIYATLARGHKPGGVNTDASASYVFMDPIFQAFSQSKLKFADEVLINKELGLKAQLLNQRLSLRAALFHMDRKNAQLESWMYDANAGLWLGYLDSSSDATSYGGELEAEFSVNAFIELFASIGLLRTEVEQLTVFDLDVFDFVQRNKRDQAKSPERQFAVGARLQFNEKVSARLSAEGKDESYFGYYHDAKLDSFTLFNASLNYQSDELTLSLWGRNLGDRDYAVHGLYFGADPRKLWANETYLQAGEPRSFGLSAQYAF